jgi:tetratricopeptide (TPR) repeat protein
VAAGAVGLSAQQATPKPKSSGEFQAVMALQRGAGTGPDATIRAADELLAKYPDTDFKEFALTMEAGAYRKKNDIVNAQAYGERALQLNPKAYIAELLVGGLIATNIKDHDLDREGKIAKATQLLNDAIENVKAAPKPSTQMADADWEAARKSSLAEAHNGLGVLARIQKKWDEAVKEFQLADDDDPQPAYQVQLAAAHQQSFMATYDKLLADPQLPPKVRQLIIQNARALALWATDVQSRPAPQVNTSTAGLTVHDTVERIKSRAHSPMPPAVRSPAYGGTGPTTMTVRNSTAYELSVYFDGPVAKKLILAPGASQEMELAPGTFHVAGSVTALDVLPFYGEDTYASSAQYSMTFYISQ